MSRHVQTTTAGGSQSFGALGYQLVTGGIARRNLLDSVAQLGRAGGNMVRGCLLPFCP